MIQTTKITDQNHPNIESTERHSTGYILAFQARQCLLDDPFAATRLAATITRTPQGPAASLGSRRGPSPFCSSGEESETGLETETEAEMGSGTGTGTGTGVVAVAAPGGSVRIEPRSARCWGAHRPLFRYGDRCHQCLPRLFCLRCW